MYARILAMFAALLPLTVPAQEPVAMNNDRCRLCHVPHEGHQVNAHHGECLLCHTAETRHLTEGGKGNVVFPDAGRCLSCHKTNDHRRMNWAFAEHGKAALQCRDCHGLHSPKVKDLEAGLWQSDRNSALCMACHKDVAARLSLPSHHPVREGGLSCVSCHDPHASKVANLAERNRQCTKCHQSVRGPKVFEHPPVVEDCTICHDPHGSPNRRLLQLAQPMQCLQCHSLAANMHGNPPRGAQLRACTNCHSAVHGSHSDSRLKY